MVQMKPSISSLMGQELFSPGVKSLLSNVNSKNHFLLVIEVDLLQYIVFVYVS